MKQRIVEAKYLKEYQIRLKFSDGTVGVIDFKHELEGDIFMPLKKLEYFKRFQLHPDLHTLTWPNGADFAPEFLYRARKRAAA